MSLKERIAHGRGGWGRGWIIVLISIFLAALVWLFVNLSNEYYGTISVPVVAHCNIEGHGNTSSNTVIVSARCRTDGYRLVREYSRRERKVVTVNFDAADMRRSGPDTYSLIGGAKNSYVNQFFGEGTKVEAFITDSLRFFFPPENHKKVPVEIPKSLGFRPQYMQAGPFKVDPDSVTVYGEASQLEAIEKLTTARLSINDLHDNRHGVLGINPVKGVRLSVDAVSYEIPVARYVEVRTQMPMEVWNAPAGQSLQVYPPMADVVLLCRFPLPKDPIPSFKLYIDWKDYSSSITGKCVPRLLRLPPGVLEYRVSPEVFDCIEAR